MKLFDKSTPLGVNGNAQPTLPDASLVAADQEIEASFAADEPVAEEKLPAENTED